jgi:hypothetical protein
MSRDADQHDRSRELSHDQRLADRQGCAAGQHDEPDEPAVGRDTAEHLVLASGPADQK